MAQEKAPNTEVAWAYEQLIVPRQFRFGAEQALELASLTASDRVLSVACGTGIATRLAAARHPDLQRVVGLDIDSSMLAVAEAVAQAAGVRGIEWVQASALELPLGDDEFTVAFCLHGLQFFDPRAKALAEVYRVLRGGGRLIASVWRSLDSCPGFKILCDGLRRVGVDSSGLERPYALGNSQELIDLASAAGFTDCRTQPHFGTITFDSIEHFLSCLSQGGFASRRALGMVPDDRKQELMSFLNDSLSPWLNADGLSLPMEGVFLLARKSGDGYRGR